MAAYTKCLVLASSLGQLLEPNQQAIPTGAEAHDIAHLQREIRSMEHAIKRVQEEYEKNLLNLVVVIGYLRPPPGQRCNRLVPFPSRASHPGRIPENHQSSRAAVKALFHWAQDNEMMDHGPELRAIKNVRKTKRKERDEQQIPSQRRQTFTATEIRRLLQHADVKMTAMIWLGINCGFGGSDIGDLR